MTISEKLNEYKALTQQVNRIREELEAVRASGTLHAHQIRGVPSGPVYASDLSDHMAKVEELERRYYKTAALWIEQRLELTRLFLALPMPYSTVLISYYLSGHTCAELAHEWGVSLRQVAKLKAEALRMLQTKQERTVRNQRVGC